MHGIMRYFPEVRRLAITSCVLPQAHINIGGMHFSPSKPIGLSDDRKRLDMQFFWLAKGNHSQVGILQRPALPVDLDQGPNITKLYNVLTDQKICSGDEISLETDDPVAHPLPDLRLLEMQWFLTRVAAMSGVAEPQDEFDDDSDDDLPMAPQEEVEFVHGG